MAVWRLVEKSDAKEMALLYSASAVPERLAWQRCGACEVALVDDLLAWVADEAEGGDLIETPAGLYVKLLGPAGGPGRA